jgi:hypothetical protein
MARQIGVSSDVKTASQLYFTLDLEVSAEPAANININKVEHTRTHFTGNVLVVEENEID